MPLFLCLRVILLLFYFILYLNKQLRHYPDMHILYMCSVTDQGSIAGMSLIINTVHDTEIKEKTYFGYKLSLNHEKKWHLGQMSLS